MIVSRALPLRWALPALAVGSLLVLLAAASALNLRYAIAHAEKEALSHVRHELSDAHRRLASQDPAVDPLAVDAEIAQLAADPNVERVALVDADGRMLSISNPDGQHRELATAFPGFDRSTLARLKSKPQTGVEFDDARTAMTAYQPVALPRPRGNVQAAHGALLLRYSLASKRQDALLDMGRFALWGLLFALLIGALLTVALRRWLALPLRALEAALARIGQGDHDHPVAVDGPSEFTDLGRSVDLLRQQLAAADAQRAQYLADLAKSEALLKSITEGTTDAVFAKDRDGCYLMFNGAASQLAARPCEQILGRDDRALFPEQQARQIMSLDEAIRQSGETITVEEELASDRGDITFLSTKGPIRDQQGEIIGTFGIARDISERKRGERALEEGERRFRTLLTHLSAGVVVHGPDTAILYANPAASTLLGLTQDQIQGKTAIDPDWCFLSQDGSPMPLAGYPVNRVLASGDPLKSYVVGVRHPDRREETWVLCNAYPARDEADALSQVVVTFTDITEQQEVQHRLRASEQRYRDLINTTEGIVWEIDARSLRFTFVSDYAERLLGFPASDWLAPDFWAGHLHPDDRHWALELRASCTARLQSHDFEYRFLAKDGSIRWLRDIVTVVAEDGAPRWLRGVMVDVTERKRDSEELRLQNTVLTHIAEGVNMVRGSDGVIVFANARFEQMFGYDTDELLGMHASALNAPAECTPEEKAEEILRALAETGLWSGEVYNRKKDGTAFWCSASVSAFDHPEHGRVWVTVQQDITDRKQAERELARHRDDLEKLVEERTQQLALAKEQAEAANLAKSAFLSNMSHELRTPLHLVLGMTDLALESATDETQSRYLGKVRKSGEHLLAIINDILDIAKIDAGALTIHRAPFSVSAMLGEALALVGPLAAAKGLGLTSELALGLPDRLLGDALRIKQILINYVGNAIKFSAHGEIRVRVEAPGMTDQSVNLRISVSDQGIGIPLERQSQLFGDFVQVDSSVTRKYGGTGLGLSICRKLATLMEGEVGFESHEGAGSTFWFTVVLEKTA